MSQDDAAPTGQAWRVICTSRADGMRTESRQRVRMTVPPSDVIDPGGSAGFWVEVRDPDEQVRYRRVLPDPADDVEVPAAPGRGAFARRQLEGPRRFAFVVPDLPEGDHASLMRAAPEGAVVARAELLRVPLDASDDGELREEEGGDER